MNTELIKDIKVELTVEIGRKKMTLKEILSTNHGSILELDNKTGTPLNFFVNGKLFGTCEIVQMPNDKLGMKVVQIFGKK
jgi:flagellar motor switch protein FliN/FliY